MRQAALASAVAFSLLAGATVHADDQSEGLIFGRFRGLRRIAAGAGGNPARCRNRRTGRGHLGASFGWQDIERSIATRADTPFHLDGVTQIVTATLVLRCVEEGRLSLDDRIGQFIPDSPNANATIRQILTHTPARRTILSSTTDRNGSSHWLGYHQDLHRQLVP